MKINIGDIISVELLNKLHMFVQIVYQIPRKNSKRAEKISSKSQMNYYIKWYPGFFIANTFKQISLETELKNKDIMFKGVFLLGSSFKGINYKVISQDMVSIEKIEFPETIDANREEGFLLRRGELKFTIMEYEKIKKYPKHFIEELENGPSSGFMDIYSMGDSVLYLQNRKNELQREYFDGWKYYPSDLKYYPELRNRIYKIINENQNETYYDLALKYGFDTKELYK